MSVAFYGLLIPPLSGESAVNLPGGTDSLDIYLQCAATCRASFAHWGYDWTLATNEVERLAERCRAIGLADLPLRDVSFEWSVPEDIRFRSAHYKLELMLKFASGGFGDRVALVDLDAVCARAMPTEAMQAGALIGYDMSAVAQRGGQAQEIADSLRLLGFDTEEARWWGGEFIMGDRCHFEALSRQLLQKWPLYTARIADMAHVGDEMVLTSGLEALRFQGMQIADGGAMGVVARYWSARTRTPFPPFQEVGGASILHLPADKPFLARWANRRFDPAEFRDEYLALLRGKARLRRWLVLADKMRGRPHLFAPQI